MRAHGAGKAADQPTQGAPARRAGSPGFGASAVSSGTLSPQAILALQRSIGNAAVSRLIQESRHQHGAGCGHPQDTTPVQRSTVHDVLRSGGQPLDTATRADMEGRLGADFSDVRLHTGAAARRSSAEVGARAYTSGNHVVIGEGGGDKHTLAHELTHVIQQRRGPVSGTDSGDGLRISDPSDRFEREAEQNARRVLSGPMPTAADRPAAGAETGAGPASGAGPAAVQRAVGFEFETSLETLAVAPGLSSKERSGETVIKQFGSRGVWEPRSMNEADSGLGRGLRKKEVIAEVPGRFTIEADETMSGGSDLEIVTAPFPETAGGRAQLSETMAAIAGVAAFLSSRSGALSAGEVAKKAGGSARVPVAPPGASASTASKLKNTLGLKSKPIVEYAVKSFGSQITANPQSTAGVSLDRIPALINSMPAPTGGGAAPTHQQSLSFMDPNLVQSRARERVMTHLPPGSEIPGTDAVPAAPASEELRGLLTLIASYLISGAEARGQAYVKGIIPLLARTDFATMFGRLTAGERAIFTAAPGRFAELAVQAAEVGAVDAPVYGGRITRPGEEAFDISHVTRRAWLEGMVHGEDVLSSSGYRNHDWNRPDNDEKAQEFESMGSLGGALDDHTKPILELRRMRKNVGYQDWSALALTVFDTVQATNH